MFGLPGAIESKILLQRYLECSDEAEAARLLERLVTRHADPIIRKTLAAKGMEPDEREGTHTLALGDVTQLLRKARAAKKPEPIRNFAACVRLLTHQAFGTFLEEKYPSRRRLKNRLRYLFGHEPLLKSWTTAEDGVVCGLSTWQAEKSKPGRGGRWQNLREDPCGEAEHFWTQGSPAQAALGPLVYALLQWVGHPVALEDLVTVAGVLQNVFEPAREAIPPDPDAADPLTNLPDDRVNVAEETQQMAVLREMWDRICRLKIMQRRCLLLGKDAFGAGLLEMVVILRVARKPDIAVVLAYPDAAFNHIWNDLPWDDNRIAQELETTPANVRFHRCEARRKLRERGGE